MSWSTLMIVDAPDGTRKIVQCNTPMRLTTRESVTVFDAEGGWTVPEGFRLRFMGSATVKIWFGRLFQDVPWVVYCALVQDTPSVDVEAP